MLTTLLTGHRVGPRLVAATAATFVSCLTLVAQTGQSRRGLDEIGADYSPKAPVEALSPEEEAKRFILPTGYRMELVLAEPVIENPVAMAFDGNGRLFVVEMRGYMPNADGTNQKDKVSRISLHESTRSDGVYDRHTVFVDNLVLPRMVVPLDGSILTMETDSDDVFQYWDTDKDGVADKKELFYSGAGRRGNLEHQQSGFIWALDNWIYSTYNAFRLRWTPTGIKREPTAPNGGQWGLTQDDYGKVWFVDAGGEVGPVNFQVPIHYGRFFVADQFEPDFEVVWPAVPGLADMQGGMPRVRTPVGVLNHFTATCGQDIFRGHRLPDDLRGDLLFAEPVGRLIRRAKVVVTEGLTQLQNAYPGSEFVLSSDPIFRPVNMSTAPDGTLLVADMYHGIIQESNWTRPGTYLRKKIEQYQLDKIVQRGRIWRLVHDQHRPDTTQPRMLAQSPAELIPHLEHPNGWWRDTAQRLLVLRQDKSVVPTLVEKVRSSPSLVARFHALWTLEGLDALETSLLRAQLQDPNPQMRVQAIRASESLYKAGDKTFEADIRALAQDKDTNVVIQSLLTLNLWKVQGMPALVKAAQAERRTRGVREIGDQILKPPSPIGGGGFRLLTAAQQDTLLRGEAIYAELCYACHGTAGKGAPLSGAPSGTKMAPSLVGSPRLLGHRDYAIRTLLHGLTGPIEGNTYAGVMTPMGDNTDEWVATVVSFVRNSFGNRAPFVTAGEVARVRSDSGKRAAFWTVEELATVVPVLIEPQPAWRATASHRPENARRPLAPTGGAWTTGAPQAAGMWFQLELPEVTTITEIQFDSVPSFRQPPRPPTPTSAATPPGAARPDSGEPARAGSTNTPAPQASPALPAIPSFAIGFPRGYKVEVSRDGQVWGPPIAQGAGAGLTTVIPFAPVKTRFIRITQTASSEDAPAWSIERLKLYRPGRQPATR